MDTLGCDALRRCTPEVQEAEAWGKLWGVLGREKKGPELIIDMTVYIYINIYDMYIYINTDRIYIYRYILYIYISHIYMYIKISN